LERHILGDCSSSDREGNLQPFSNSGLLVNVEDALFTFDADYVEEESPEMGPCKFSFGNIIYDNGFFQ
jgi:hypothetical protein